jgi:hypothetical protein
MITATAVCRLLGTEQTDKSDESTVALCIQSASTLSVLPALWPQSALRAADGLSLLQGRPRDFNDTQPFLATDILTGA